MLTIDPQLTQGADHSPYRQVIREGYRSLRFPAALEAKFQRDWLMTQRRRTRWAAGLAFVLFALFALIDRKSLPQVVWQISIPIRVGIVLPTLLTLFWATYRKLQAVPALLIAASLAANGTIVAVIGTAYYHRFLVPYEGLLLGITYVYFMSGLTWWRALAVNFCTLVAYVSVEWLLQPTPALPLYHTVFVLAMSLIGAIGAYFYELSARTNFLGNALLQEMAERDELTGLYNRRSLNLHLDRVWRQAQRERVGVALAMVDIDFFKRYNDFYGHFEGDAALCQVARALRAQASRPLDLAARFGGEEFTLLWYGVRLEEAATLAEHARAAVEAMALPHARSPQGKVTVSVGVAFLHPGPHNQPGELLRCADQALYAAKEAGRNRVVAPAAGAVPETA
jgi:diguanylate cyclase (GGDEF)-like protein